MRACAGYNWEEMRRDGYQWWRRRLSHMAQYFSAYRVDHILGFFRVYEVPERHIFGALGHFRPSFPISRAELEARGLWDIDRLCEPYITDEILREAVGSDLDEVVGKYVEAGGAGWQLRKAWRSERALAAIAAPLDAPAWLAAVRKIP